MDHTNKYKKYKLKYLTAKRLFHKTMKGGFNLGLGETATGLYNSTVSAAKAGAQEAVRIGLVNQGTVDYAENILTETNESYMNWMCAKYILDADNLKADKDRLKKEKDDAIKKRDDAVVASATAERQRLEAQEKVTTLEEEKKEADTKIREAKKKETDADALIQQANAAATSAQETITRLQNEKSQDDAKIQEANRKRDEAQQKAKKAEDAKNAAVIEKTKAQQKAKAAEDAKKTAQEDFEQKIADSKIAAEEASNAKIEKLKTESELRIRTIQESAADQLKTISQQQSENHQSKIDVLTAEIKKIKENEAKLLLYKTQQVAKSAALEKEYRQNIRKLNNDLRQSKKHSEDLETQKKTLNELVESMKERETAMETVLEKSKKNEEMLKKSVDVMQSIANQCEEKSKEELNKLQTKLIDAQNNAKQNNEDLQNQLIELQKQKTNAEAEANHLQTQVETMKQDAEKIDNIKTQKEIDLTTMKLKEKVMEWLHNEHFKPDGLIMFIDQAYKPKQRDAYEEKCGDFPEKTKTKIKDLLKTDEFNILKMEDSEIEELKNEVLRKPIPGQGEETLDLHCKIFNKCKDIEDPNQYIKCVDEY